MMNYIPYFEIKYVFLDWSNTLEMFMDVMFSDIFCN